MSLIKICVCITGWQCFPGVTCYRSYSYHRLPHGNPQGEFHMRRELNLFSENLISLMN